MNSTGIWSVAVTIAAVASAALAGCVGNDDGGDRSGFDGPESASGVIRELKSRPLDLPSVDLRGPSIRAGGIAGRCFRETEVGAIALPAIPGEAALGPWPGEAELRRGPVYAALLAGPPRIVYFSGLPTIGGSRWRVVRTIWVSRPSYDGAVLVRGGRLERPGGLGFGSQPRPQSDLRLPARSWRGVAQSPTPDAPKGWRAAAIPTRIRTPGCYAFQVDGLEFSYVLAFGVQAR
ncbi:MAG TPA: hypothetical protein VE505_10430 [Vicinamibacterales bacterium]|nr:hypothetical protein [Vicinamibacterales bacterium]